MILLTENEKVFTDKQLLQNAGNRWPKLELKSRERKNRKRGRKRGRESQAKKGGLIVHWKKDKNGTERGFTKNQINDWYDAH